MKNNESVRGHTEVVRSAVEVNMCRLMIQSKSTLMTMSFLRDNTEYLHIPLSVGLSACPDEVHRFCWNRTPFLFP